MGERGTTTEARTVRPNSVNIKRKKKTSPVKPFGESEGSGGLWTP